MNKLINEIFVCFYKWIQLELDLDMSEVKKMFELLIENDRKFIRYCPEAIENDIFAFEAVIGKLSSENRLLLKKFINGCIDCYNYDRLKNKTQSAQLDLLYYRAAIAQFYINSCLSVLDISKFASFRKEFYQIGVQIGNFYSSKEDKEKKVIGQIIKSKTSELFRRYKFDYSLPLCSI